MAFFSPQNPGIGGLDELTTTEEGVVQDLGAISHVQGQIIYDNGTDWVALAPGTSGYFLRTNGAAANPSWAVGSATVATLDDIGDVVLTAIAQGHILYYSGTAWVNLAPGTNGYFLKTQGAAANPVWAAVSATPAGADTQVQFNDAGILGGDAGFVYNKTTDTATLAGNLQCEDLLIEDSDASHYLAITTTSNLSATRTLTLVPGDANRTLTISGNATISQDYSTTGNPQFATIELGAATDTTLSRSAAGVIAVEGIDITTISGTQTLTNKTIALGSNTISGTKAQFDTAVTDDNFAYLATAQSFTALQTLSLAGNTLRLVNTTDAASVQVARFEGDRATMADGDEAYISLMLSNDGGTQVEFSRLGWSASDVNVGTGIDGIMILYVAVAGTITSKLEITGTAVRPTANDGLALGTTTLGYSDLHLATGALINVANGDAVITHSTGIFTVSTGDLRVTTAGTNAASVVTVGGTQTLTNKTLTSPTLTTPSAFTTGGNITLAENTSIDLDPAGSADGKYTGICITGTAGTTLVFGDLIYLSSADSRWELVDADAVSTSGNILIGMCVLAAAADGSATKILLQGQIRADAKFPALTIGAAVYAGETAGAIQVAIPTGTDGVVRVVGFALTADEIYFNPSQDHITII